MKRFRFAMLDFDGTLVDNGKFYRSIIRRFLFSNPILFKFYFSILEKETLGPRRFFKKEFKSLVYSFSEIIEPEKLKTFRGVKTFLTELRRRKIRIFLTTRSNRTRTEKILKDSKLSYFFELILSGEIPKREHIYFLKKYTGLTDKQFADYSFYLGDEPMDMCLAKEHSIFAVGITNTFNSSILKKYGAKITISNIGELTKLIKEIPETKKEPIK